MRHARALRFATVAAALVGLVAGALFLAAGFLRSDPVSEFAATGPRRPFAALYLSGDMGLRFGIGPRVAAALAKSGIPVLGLNSPTLFGHHRTRAEVEAIVAQGARETLARTRAPKVVLIGQSFGADMIATALPALPADLRSRVLAAVLVVPGRAVYFRADPLGFAYRGTPDAAPAAALRTVGWTSVLCIQGMKETDSLCPGLAGGAARRVVLPGGHFLQNDDHLVTTTILRVIDATAAGSIGS
ncbi:AcvB/VirJ family lysyl-phosphatidylglycerol hydrolase [Sphingomonas sp.]|uniref:AcvB/VirJ family lysyl-phosphatidylglycerol hydrolase n=1 Tax=Sphingomonas sp. TaxID=28214 RepID=UPI003B00C9E2